MQFFKYNRKVAWLLLVVTIAFSLVFGVYRSVAQLESKTERIYRTDSAQYGSAQADIAKTVNYARELYSITTAAFGENAALHDAITALDKAKDSPIGQDGLLSALHQEAAIAYNRITNDSSLPESSKTSATLYFYEITSTMARLSGNRDYADAAERYNRLCTSFPGSLTGRAPAATYK